MRKPPNRSHNRSRRRRQAGRKNTPRSARARQAAPKVAASLKPKPKSRANPRMRETKRIKYGRLTDNALKFLEESEKILNDFDVKRKVKRKYSCPYESPLGEFKRKSYSLIKRLINSPGGSKTIINIHDNYSINHKGPERDENPFYWGLIAFPEIRKILTPHQIGLFSRQMLYADRHDVPPCLFVGFLLQIGKRSKVSQSDLQEDKRENWEQQDLVLRFASPDKPEETVK